MPNLRPLHRWAAVLTAVPLLVIIVTGILLQFRDASAWVQPPLQRGSALVPTVTLEQVLDKARSVPELDVKDWADISRLDVRPGAGTIRIQAKSSRWEAQVDAATGDVLQVAYRRLGVIEALHQGSWLHNGVRWGVFVPAAFVLLGLWGTGLYLFVLPILVRRRRKAAVPAQHG